MAKFEMNQQFEHRKSHRLAHIALIDESRKTITLVYNERHEKDSETGLCLSYPSVSKSWKRLDTYFSTEEVAEEKSAESKDEEVAGDGTSYSQVMSEILADEKQLVKDKKKLKSKNNKQNNKAEVTDVRDSVFARMCSFIEKTLPGVDIRTYEKTPYMLVLRRKGEKKIFMEIRLGKKAYTLNVKKERADRFGLDYHTINNYYLPAALKITDFEDFDVLSKLLKEEN